MAVTIGCLLRTLDPVCFCFPRATILMILKEKLYFQKRISPGNQAGGRSRHNPFLSYVAVDGCRGLVGLLVLMPKEEKRLHLVPTLFAPSSFPSDFRLHHHDDNSDPGFQFDFLRLVTNQLCLKFSTADISNPLCPSLRQRLEELHSGSSGSEKPRGILEIWFGHQTFHWD